MKEERKKQLEELYAAKVQAKAEEMDIRTSRRW